MGNRRVTFLGKKSNQKNFSNIFRFYKIFVTLLLLRKISLSSQPVLIDCRTQPIKNKLTTAFSQMGTRLFYMHIS